MTEPMTWYREFEAHDVSVRYVRVACTNPYCPSGDHLYALGGLAPDTGGATRWAIIGAIRDTGELMYGEAGFEAGFEVCLPAWRRIIRLFGRPWRMLSEPETLLRQARAILNMGEYEISEMLRWERVGGIVFLGMQDFERAVPLIRAMVEYRYDVGGSYGGSLGGLSDEMEDVGYESGGEGDGAED